MSWYWAVASCVGVVGVLVGLPLATIGASNWWQRRQDAQMSNKPKGGNR